jgi:tetratricopeptide (TPR) repeat protein
MKAQLLVVLILVSGHAEAAKRGKPPARTQPAQPVIDKRAADEAFVSGNYDRAVSLYTPLLSSPRLTAGDRETIYLNRGYSNLRLNRLGEAAKDLRQAIALNPTSAEAAAGLHALQNRGSAQASPSPASPEVSIGWGPLARLPGKFWIVSTTKPLSHLRYDWDRIGVSMNFAGTDLEGNRIEGRYFIDPASNGLRVSLTHRGKAEAAAVHLSVTEFATLLPGKKKGGRQIAQLQSDGTFNILTQKLRDDSWHTLSVATLMPAAEQAIAALGWPDQPPPKRPSLVNSVLNSLKEGALEGFRDGMRDGVQDAVRHRTRQITGTPEMCQTVGGEVIRCSKKQ